MTVNVDTGTVLGDRYRLAERIATGGMGEVWRARDELLDRDVAVKLLKHEYADDEGFVQRFRAEAKHAAGLAHPGIAGVFDYGEGAGTSYLVMELVPGEPLSAMLAREGRLPAGRALEIVEQAARGLEAAHAGGVIHRDIKPGNILVCPDGTVKLTDFGIARAADAVPLTKTGTVMGTAHYLSPEQSNGRPVTPASDVYSLGVVAYECLAGRRPFDGDNPVGIAMAHLYEDPPPLPPDVPEPAAHLVLQALSKEPADRFATAAAFAKAAAVTRAGLAGDVTAPTMALPVTTAPARSRDTRRRAAYAAVAAGLVLVLLVAAFALLRPPPRRTVPLLRGKTKAAAYALLAKEGLKHTDKTAYSSGYPTGTVMVQDPAPGAHVRKGDNVAVTISLGPQPVALPAGLVGRPRDAVVADLRALGLAVTAEPVESDLPFGTVVTVTPPLGLHKGDAVKVTYSTGRPRPTERKKHGKGDR
jgi:serine/threonine-protein kinase